MERQQSMSGLERQNSLKSVRSFAGTRGPSSLDLSMLRRKDSRRKLSKRRSTVKDEPERPETPKFNYVYNLLNHTQQHQALEAYFKYDNTEAEIPQMLDLLGLYIPLDFDLTGKLKEMGQDEASGQSVQPEAFLHIVNAIWAIQMSRAGEDAEIKNAYEALKARRKEELTNDRLLVEKSTMLVDGNPLAIDNNNITVTSPHGGEKKSPWSTPGGQQQYLYSPGGGNKNKLVPGSASPADSEFSTLEENEAFQIGGKKHGHKLGVGGSSPQARRSSLDSLGAASGVFSQQGSMHMTQSGMWHRGSGGDPLRKMLAPLMTREYNDFRRFLRTRTEDPVFIRAFIRLGAVRSDSDDENTENTLALDTDKLRRKCEGIGCDEVSTQIILNLFDDDVNGEIDFSEFKRVLTMDLTGVMSPELVEYLRKLLRFDEGELATALAKMQGVDQQHHGGGGHDPSSPVSPIMPRVRTRSIAALITSQWKPGERTFAGEEAHAVAGDAEAGGGAQKSEPRTPGALGSVDWDEFATGFDESVSSSILEGTQYNPVVPVSRQEVALRRVQHQLEKIDHHVNKDMKKTASAARKLLIQADKLTNKRTPGLYKQQRRRTKTTTVRPPPAASPTAAGETNQHHSTASSTQQYGHSNPNSYDSDRSESSDDDDEVSVHKRVKLPELGPDRRPPKFRSQKKCQFEYKPPKTKKVKIPQPPGRDGTRSALLPTRTTFLGTLPSVCTPRQPRTHHGYRTGVDYTEVARSMSSGSEGNCSGRRSQSPSSTAEPAQGKVSSEPEAEKDEPAVDLAVLERGDEEGEGKETDQSRRSKKDKKGKKKNKETSSERNGNSETTPRAQQEEGLQSLCKDVIDCYSQEAKRVVENDKMFAFRMKQATLPRSSTHRMARQELEVEAVTTTNGRYFVKPPPLPSAVDTILSENTVREERIAASARARHETFRDANKKAKELYEGMCSHSARTVTRGQL